MSGKKQKLLIFLLVVSFCFNFFFLAGYWKIRINIARLRVPEFRVRLIGKHLDLTADQTNRALELTTELKEYRQNSQDKYAGEINEFWYELQKQNPDYERVHELIDLALAERQKFVELAAENAQEFMKTLTPQQRRVAVKKLKRLQSFLQDKSPDDFYRKP
jgi:Spy/CpxP family protein refolding chaperone